jgi:hypothetical protein
MSRPLRHTPERLVRANGLKLCIDTFGEPEHQPVVLIMGMGAQMIGWDDGVLRATGRTRFPRYPLR